MATSLRVQRHPFRILGLVAASWNGSPQTLQVNQNATMPQTPNGTMTFACFNQSTQNNSGSLFLTSGGSQPESLTVPALAQQPLIVMNNWMANNLSVTNVSANGNTPIWIGAFGPGIPGQFPANLPTDGTTVPLSPGQSAQGNTLPQYMQLVLQCNNPSLTVFTIIGGPLDASANNGYAIILNAASNVPPLGYWAATTGNSYAFSFNWGGALLYVANMSPFSSAGASVALRRL